MKSAHTYSSSRRRSAKGIAICEEVAALALMLPLIMFVLVAAVEVASLMLVKNTLNEAARAGARNCAMAYHWPPHGSSNTPSGQPYSPAAQGDTVAPATTSGDTPVASPTVVGTDGGADPTGQPKTPNDAWSRIRIKGIVGSNTQFSAVYRPASVNDSSDPQNQIGHVTVTVTSQPGSFPGLDPLNLRVVLPNFTISSSSTYAL